MHAFLEFLENMAFSQWVKNAPTIWAFPTILVLHTIGMGIVAGGSSMLSLMILGFWPAVPMKPFARVFPVMWAGFWLNAVTGTMMLVADATTKLTKGTWKVYRGIGKLTKLKGSGTFTVKGGHVIGEFILEIEGDYEL